MSASSAPGRAHSGWPEDRRPSGLAEHRNAGVGTTLIRRILDDAADEGLPVDLEVKVYIPDARRLVARLGFCPPVTSPWGTLA